MRKVLLIDEPVLVHVDPTCYIVRRGEWIAEKGVECLQVADCPFAITV